MCCSRRFQLLLLPRLALAMPPQAPMPLLLLPLPRLLLLLLLVLLVLLLRLLELLGAVRMRQSLA